MQCPNWLVRSRDCGNAKNTKEELIIPDWWIQQPALCFMNYEQKIVPLALTKCHVPLALRMSCAPGSWISLHWSSPHEQSSHIFRSASVGVSEITSLYRWHSPSHVEVFHHRKLALGHLSHWLAQTQHTWCPPLIHGQSPLSSTVGIHSL